MEGFSQGDIVKIQGFRSPFLILSKNAYISSTNTFHVCPFLEKEKEGPLHIPAKGIRGTEGKAICEQIKLIDPAFRACSRQDRLSYKKMMEILDALQGIFEYD